MKKICLAVFLALVLVWVLQPAVHAQSSDLRFQELLRKIDGRRYGTPGAEGSRDFIGVRGKFFVLGFEDRNGRYSEVISPGPYIRMQGRETTISDKNPFTNRGYVRHTFIIDEDGESITRRVWFPDENFTRESIYLWQR
jgi:hypothetical protein